MHDDAFYVPKELFEEWAAARPLERFRSWLRDNADMTDEEEEEVSAGVKKMLNGRAPQGAEESPLPDPASLTRVSGRRRKSSTRPTTSNGRATYLQAIPTASARRCGETSASS